ncbi:chromate transporter [Lachnospiraceae bacterium KH1T2]|nr:chromate transporter [Lachnospiraceae bacterium KH1T2]
MNIMLAIRLFYEFFKTGLFAIGGGLATLPFLYEISAKTGWFTTADIANMIAVSESTPGPMGVNMATYVGYSTLGIPGAVISTLGLIAPSVIIIVLVAGIMKKFRESELVQKVFYGFRPASTALIAAAGLGVAKISLLNIDVYEKSGDLWQLFNYPRLILAVIIFIAIRKTRLHPIVFIFAAAVAGVVFGL